MSSQLFTTLNNKMQMPLLGFGTYALNGKEAERAVLDALETGYRLIDTATMYGNEIEIGNAVRSSRLPRSEVFVTTKLNNSDHGYDAALKAFESSLKKLHIDYIDLYLIHWPIKAKRKDSWKALEQLYQTGQVRAIGVANYLVPFLKELETYSEVVPVVDQVEFSPFLYIKNLVEYCRSNKIQLQSYTPLTKGEKFNDPRLVAISKKYDKTPAQIILRWNVQQGISAIPKSSNAKRIKENFSIFDFELSNEDIETMNNFNENYRVIMDPTSYL